MSDPDLDAIETRANAATPGGIGFGGTWGCDLIDDTWYVTAQSWDLASLADRPREMGGSPDQRRADAEFIAHARADIPQLIARVRELEAQVEAQS